MGFTIRQKADRIGAFRFVSVFAMETLARWVPTTPELEVKVLLGRHVWDFAQHADLLGRRTGELRAPLQYSHQPADGYRRVLDTMAAAEATLDRVVAFYDVFLPDLARRYRDHMAATDPIGDEPSIRIIERILFDFPRHAAERARLASERPDLPPANAQWLAEFARLVDGERSFVSERTPRAEAGAT